MNRFIFFLSFMLLVPLFAHATGEERKPSGSVVYGTITTEGKAVSYAVVSVKGTALATSTNMNGYYELRNLPLGNVTLIVTYMGYRTIYQQIEVEENVRLERNFVLEIDQLEMDAVVVTGDKNEINRREASTIVSSVSPHMLRRLQSSTISEGVNFIPGVRMENNCQNCGFNQVRLNGLEGAYSQILIDGHPIFSGLANVYGMELIPANMIGSLEVVRGGGSALYGSNAIAGTINVRLRDPLSDAFEVGYDFGLNGIGVSKELAPNHSVNLNASAVTKDGRAGLAIYGYYRNRQGVDLNGDSFSDLPRLRNTTIGARAFYRFTDRSKITATYFHINEHRRGGDRFEAPDHMARISERLVHGIHSGSLMYSQYFRDNDELALSASMQSVDRDSYYGGYSLKDYGLTKDRTWNALAQYTARWNDMDLIAGVDFTQSFLTDKKPMFWDLVQGINTVNPSLPIDEDALSEILEKSEIGDRLMAKQQSNTIGIFAQYTWRHPIVNITVGARFDHYDVYNRIKENEEQMTVVIDGEKQNFQRAPEHIAGNVPVPRINFLFKILPELQVRLNYAMGYRAPQLFNEDLHVEVKGDTKIFRTNDGDLKSELSHSAMLSLDYNQKFETQALGVLIEGFYTHLQRAFIDEMQEVEGKPVVIAIRKNSEKGAYIAGFNTEINYAPLRSLSMKLGMTFKKSVYLGEVEDDNYGEKEFLRSPDLFGFFLLNWNFWKGFEFSPTFYLTGPMLVPYEPEFLDDGKFKDNDEREKYVENAGGGTEGGFVIRRSPVFADLGLKLGYTFKFKSMTMQTYVGVKNVLHSFQSDLEEGPSRASSYVYGPMQPRMFYVGVRFGNLF